MVWYKPSTWGKPKPKPTPTQQYTAPIGPTSKPDSSGVVSTPTGKVQTTSGGGYSGSSSGGNISSSQPTNVTPAGQQIINAIQSNEQDTITGKVSTPKASTSVTQVKQNTKNQAVITTAPSASDKINTPVYSLSFGAALGQSVSNLGYNVKTFFTGRSGDRYRSVTAPFELVGMTRKDQPLPYEQRYTMGGQGTLSYTSMGTVYTPTYGDLYKEQLVNTEIEEMGIRNNLQSQVSSGAITVEEAQEQYNKQTKNIYETQAQILGNAYEKPAQTDIQAISTGAKLGLTAGAFAINPLLGTSLLVGEGVYKLSARPDINTGVSESLFAARANLAGQEFYSPSFERFSAMRTEGTMALAGGAIGAVSVPFKIGSDITNLRIAEGLSKPQLTTTRPLQYVNGEEGGISITRSSTKNFELFQKFEFVKRGDYVTGSGKVTVRYLDFMRQGTGLNPWVSSTKTLRAFYEVGSGNLVGMGRSIGGTSIYGNVADNLQNSVIRFGYITSGDNVLKITPQGSISMNSGDIVVSRSGPLTGFSIANNKATPRFSLKNIGILKPGFYSDTSSSFSRFGGGNFGGSNGLGTIVSTQTISDTFSGSLARDVASSISSPSSTTVPIVTPKVPIKTTQTTRPSPTFSTQILSSSTTQTNNRNTQLVVPQLTTSLTGNRNRFSSSVLATTQLTVLTQKQPQRQIPSIRFAQSTISKQTSRQTSSFGFPTFPTLAQPVVSAPGFGVGGFGLSIPSLPFGSDSLGRVGKIKASRRYRYTPSFGALVKGTGFFIGEETPKRFTGLEFRGPTAMRKTRKKR